MATLTGNTIASTYSYLLKLEGTETPLDTDLQTVEDGVGTDSALQISTAQVKTTGTLAATGAATLSTSVTLATGATVTGIDNGGLATGSATLLATQGAIKTYVDAQVGASDTLTEVLENGNTTGAFNISVNNGQSVGTDTITETTADTGVTIDGVVLKDTEVTTGAWKATVVADEYGGTGQSTYAKGDILVATAANTLSKLTIGTANSILTSGATDVSWATAFTGNVTGDLTGTASLVTVTDSASDTAFPVVFNNESDALLDDTGAFTYNPNSSTVAATTFAGALTGNASGSSGSCTGNSATATLASTVTVTDSTADTAFPVTFHDESNALLDDTGAFTYNPNSSTVSATTFAGALTGNASGSSGSCTGNAATATKVYVTDNEATAEENLISFVAGAATTSGNHGLEMDGDLKYNPSTGTVTSTVFAGNLTGDVTGNADTSTKVYVTDNEATAEENLISFVAGAATTSGNHGLEMDGDLKYNPSTGTVTSTVFSGALTGNASGSSGSCTGNSASATKVYVTDNESTNEENLISFVADAAVASGNQDLEMDGNLTYNPSSGSVTATTFIGALTGNASGSAATVTGAAQGAITSVGTLTDLTVSGTSTTIGTVTSGIWQGTAIDGAYIDIEGTEIKSTGPEADTKYLRADGDGTCSWQTVSGSGTMTGITPSADTNTATPVEIPVTGTLTFAGGTGIDTDLTVSSSSGFTVSSALDLNELTNDTDTADSGWSAGDFVAIVDSGDSSSKKIKLPAEIGIACSDETTALDTVEVRATFLIPRAMTVTEVKASLTDPDTGTGIGIQVNVHSGDPSSGTSTVLNSELSLGNDYSAATTTFNSTNNVLAEDAFVNVEITSVDSGAKGLKVWLLGYYT